MLQIAEFHLAPSAGYNQWRRNEHDEIKSIARTTSSKSRDIHFGVGGGDKKTWMIGFCSDELEIISFKIPPV